MGKPKYIETPEKMWELFLEYRKEVKENPRIKIEYVGKDGVRVETPIERPLILVGFFAFCHDKIGCVHQYFKNQDGLYDDYMPIITRIRDEIRNEQIDGGMSGSYNPNLTARINGLYDKQEITTTSTIQLLNNDPLDDSKDKI